MYNYNNQIKMHQSCGDINEKGFLNNLLRKGFTHAKSLSEIHANSVDARSGSYFIYCFAIKNKSYR